MFSYTAKKLRKRLPHLGHLANLQENAIVSKELNHEWRSRETPEEKEDGVGGLFSERRELCRGKRHFEISRNKKSFW